MFCYRCGAPLKEDAKFCNKCGAPVVPPEPAAPAAPAAPVTPAAPAAPVTPAAPAAPVTPAAPAAPAAPVAPDPGTEYLDEQQLEGTEYLGEEATELLSPDTPWVSPRSYDAPSAPPVTPAPPAPPTTPPPAWPTTGNLDPRGGRSARKRISPVAIAAVVIVALLGIAAIVAGILLSTGNGQQQAAPSQSGQTAEEVNWSYYAGTWKLENNTDATFTLSEEGGSVSFSLSQSVPYRSIQGVCTPEDGGQRLTYSDDGQGNSGSILLTPQGDGLSVSASSEDMNGLKYTGAATRSSAPSSGEAGAGTPSAQPTPSAALGMGDYLLYQNGQTVSYAPQDILTVTGDFHLWPTDSVRITDADLSKLTHSEIQAIRNEIYARYGYSFTDERWQKLFGGLSWYHPDPNYTQPTLPELIQDNVDTILAYETAQGWRS